MRRRAFVAGMTASVVAWPLSANAQSQTPPLIGFLGAASPEGYTPGHTPGHQSLVVKLPKTGEVVLSGDAVHFKSNWENRGVPSNNVSKEQTLASMERIADTLSKDKAQLWINHDKAQRDSLKMAPEFYD